MSRKNSLTLKRGATTVIAEGYYAITAVTVMALTFMVLAPVRAASRGISRITAGLITQEDE